MANLNIEDVSAEDAWQAVISADQEKDVNDIKKVGLTAIPATSPTS